MKEEQEEEDKNSKKKKNRDSERRYKYCGENIIYCHECSQEMPARPSGKGSPEVGRALGSGLFRYAAQGRR